METPPEHTGVLILRVWTEGDGRDGVRARILRTVNGCQAPPAAASGVDDVVTVVRAWLDQILEPGE
ncbi:hypothetical protein [Streptomyces sp. NPDC020965]|uniref:hypothetical protein n=1 Tax=Streptomyces sp. NPDC020965 TaxID=3365105 RepID=UPI00378CE8A4